MDRITVTFFGHWEYGRIVAEHWERGVIEDDREDTGIWDEGLWAASGTGETLATIWADLKDEYEKESA